MGIPENIHELIKTQGIKKFHPAQKKAIEKGLFENKNLLVVTPTASGKTLIAEMGFLNEIINKKGKALYIVPLKALASEKFEQFQNKYSDKMLINVSTGDMDSDGSYLEKYDLVISTSEKVDSLIRHNSGFLKKLNLLIVDEIHLLNSVNRGPTIEFVITILEMNNPNLKIIGLSATIGNAKEMSEWLDAELVKDTWRPVKLKKGISVNGDVQFYD